MLRVPRTAAQPAAADAPPAPAARPASAPVEAPAAPPRRGRDAPAWVRAAVAGGVAGALAGAAVASVTLLIVAALGDRLRPGFGWNGAGVVLFWLPGGAAGGLLGAFLQAVRVRWGWLIGGCVGGLLVGAWPLLEFLSPPR